MKIKITHTHTHAHKHTHTHTHIYIYIYIYICIYIKRNQKETQIWLSCHDNLTRPDTSTTNPDKSGPGSNALKDILQILLSSWTGAAPLDWLKVLNRGSIFQTRNILYLL